MCVVRVVCVEARVRMSVVLPYPLCWYLKLLKLSVVLGSIHLRHVPIYNYSDSGCMVTIKILGQITLNNNSDIMHISGRTTSRDFGDS